jgi:hypothetical protein
MLRDLGVAATEAPSFADHFLAMPIDYGTFESIGGRLRETPF